MKRIKLLSTVIAALVVVAVTVGGAFAQPTVPSLVSQQMRLSSGGATPGYVQIRAITGAAPTADFYQLDQAPVPTANVNYSLWLNDQNQIVRSNPFGPSQALYLLQVNATGNGLQWVDPASLTTLDGDIRGPVGDDSVNVGHDGLNNRLILGINNANGYDNTTNPVIAIDRGGTNSQATPTAGAVAYGDGTKYEFTGVGTSGQVLISQGVGAPIWSSVGALFVANNGLTQTDSLIQWGGPLIQNTAIAQAGFNIDFTGTGNFNVGDGTSVNNITLDPSSGGFLALKNLSTTSDTSFVVLDASGHAHVRGIGSLVSADNGLTMAANGTTVELGSAVSGGAPLLGDRLVSLASHNLTFEGAGNFNIGDGSSVMNTKIDPGATGTLTIDHLTASTDTTMLIIDPNGVVHTRGIGSLVNADNGLTVAANNTVELGSGATGGADLLSDRFVTLSTHTLNFDGAGNLNLGTGGAILNTTIDPGVGGTLTLKNLTSNTDTTMVTVDNNGIVHTRSLTTLVNADNGLSMAANGTTVELGSAATGGANLLHSSFVSMNTNTLTFDGAGAFNIGAGTAVLNTTIDPGVGGTLTVKNLTSSTDTNMMIVDPNGVVHTRSINSLVNADNGLIVNNGNTVELGSAATGGANLLRNSFVTLNGKDLNFDGAGNFNVGDGTSIQNITLDPGATGNLTINHLTTTNDTTMLILDASNHVHIRALSSLVQADNGLTIANGNTVELGSSATGGAPLLADRFVSLASHTLNFEGSGTVNVGTGGDVNLAVNTGSTGNMSINGATLDAGTGMNNFLWADTATGNVRRTKANDLTTSTSPAYYITMDANGQVTKAISPNNSIYRGHVAWTNWQQTISLPAGQTINSGATITVTVENHASAGTVAIQVTNVGATSFDIETADAPVGTSYINYIVMNP